MFLFLTQTILNIYLNKILTEMQVTTIYLQSQYAKFCNLSTIFKIEKLLSVISKYKQNIENLFQKYFYF